MTNKDIVVDIFQAVNLSGNDRILAKEIIEWIETEHRTLIQSFFRMVRKVIKGYAKHEHSDARNEGSLEWAKKVAKIDGFMPLI